MSPVGQRITASRGMIAFLWKVLNHFESAYIFASSVARLLHAELRAEWRHATVRGISAASNLSALMRAA